MNTITSLSIFLIYQGVPLYCTDGTYAVDAISLRHWLLFAIIEDDHSLSYFIDGKSVSVSDIESDVCFVVTSFCVLS